MSTIVIFVAIFLSVKGYSYYSTPLEERFYHADHSKFKASGLYGHGLGIIGTLLIVIGVFGYMARKRYRILFSLGALKYWLEFHIFLCALGPVMILFHTSFKFGGIVSVSFWSMIAVVASGVLGRFIYLQIPRTIEGKALSRNEIKNLMSDKSSDLKMDESVPAIDLDAILSEARTKASDVKPGFFGFFAQYFDNIKIKKEIKSLLKDKKLDQSEIRPIMNMVGTEISLTRKIQYLEAMQRLFRYWHIAHLPFALIMLIIMVVHVITTVIFGAKWIF
ncbi:MAG: hypothetical protein IPI60_20535 [Saprospiraceae bacterium]|nr:hypothetical protein [Saprospiraceae bacterium]